MIVMKIVKHNQWESTGHEFVEELEKQGIKYSVIIKGLEVFDFIPNLLVSGGRTFDIFEYKRKSDNERVLVAHGSFGIVDSVTEETFVFEFDYDSEKHTKEQIKKLLIEYIKKEENEILNILK